MPRKRRSYPAELKAKVALEALREEATMAARYDVHPNLIANWKKTARQTSGAAGRSRAPPARPAFWNCDRRRHGFPREEPPRRLRVKERTRF